MTLDFKRTKVCYPQTPEGIVKDLEILYLKLYRNECRQWISQYNGAKATNRNKTKWMKSEYTPRIIKEQTESVTDNTRKKLKITQNVIHVG